MADHSIDEEDTSKTEIPKLGFSRFAAAWDRALLYLDAIHIRFPTSTWVPCLDGDPRSEGFEL